MLIIDRLVENANISSADGFHILCVCDSLFLGKYGTAARCFTPIESCDQERDVGLFLTAKSAFVFSDLSRRPACHRRTVCFSAELPMGFRGSSRRVHVKLMEGMVHMESFALSFYLQSSRHLYSFTDILIQSGFYCI